MIINSTLGSTESRESALYTVDKHSLISLHNNRYRSWAGDTGARIRSLIWWPFVGTAGGASHSTALPLWDRYFPLDPWHTLEHEGDRRKTDVGPWPASFTRWTLHYSGEVKALSLILQRTNTCALLVSILLAKKKRRTSEKNWIAKLIELNHSIGKFNYFQSYSLLIRKPTTGNIQRHSSPPPTINQPLVLCMDIRQWQ